MSFTIKGKPIDIALLQSIKPKLENIGKQMLEYAKFISPTDTTDYMNNWKNDGVKVTKDNVEISISNNTDYAWILENGVQGKTYNYHKGPRANKNRKVIYSGIGNRTAQRTLDFISTKI